MVTNRLDIVFEDKDVLVVSKPTNLLSVSTLKEKERTLFHLCSSYVKKQNKNNKIFIVHRLDKDTSGVMIFAKNIAVKEELQKQFELGLAKRYYYALVSPKVQNAEMTIVNYLHIDKFGNVFLSSSKDRSAKKAITKYKVKEERNDSSLLDIEILTGKKNQIRIGLSSISSPVVGDKKYSGMKFKRLCLHSYKLDLSSYKEEYVFESYKNMF